MRQITVSNPAPGGGSSTVNYTIDAPGPNSIPITSSLSPSSVVAGAAAFVLAVNGSNFTSSSVVQWNGSNRTTTFVSARQLTAAISASDVASAGAAQVTVLSTASNGGTSNALTFTIAPPPPAILNGGVVPVYSTVTTIQSGEWVSIYGTNLADSTVIWTGNFPQSLGGTSVTINGNLAYLWYVSPTQINLQAPNDKTTGSVPVVVTTTGGTISSTVTLAEFAPSFSLLDSKHVAGIILRSNGSGTQGGGTYDIIGPVGNSLGYPTVAAKAGDTVELFAVGLGPTNPVALAGQALSGSAATTNTVNLLINNASVTPSFAGIVEAGLYQINLTIPSGLGTGDVPLTASVGGVQTPPGVVISLQ